jgi:hypothetical protein
MRTRRSLLTSAGRAEHGGAIASNFPSFSPTRFRMDPLRGVWRDSKKAEAPSGDEASWMLPTAASLLRTTISARKPLRLPPTKRSGRARPARQTTRSQRFGSSSIGALTETCRHEPVRSLEGTGLGTPRDAFGRRGVHAARSSPYCRHAVSKSLGVAPHVVQRLLNHVTGTLGGVAGVYNRFKYRDEVRAALQMWRPTSVNWQAALLAKSHMHRRPASTAYATLIRYKNFAPDSRRIRGRYATTTPDYPAYFAGLFAVKEFLGYLCLTWHRVAWRRAHAVRQPDLRMNFG